jgi:hypothetical protein
MIEPMQQWLLLCTGCDGRIAFLWQIGGSPASPDVALVYFGELCDYAYFVSGEIFWALGSTF